MSYHRITPPGRATRSISAATARRNAASRIELNTVNCMTASKLADQVVHEVREHFANQVLRTTIPRSVRVSEAPSYGQTVMTYDPASPGALSYLEAAREFARQASA